MSTAGQKRMTENDRCTNVEKYVGEIKGGLKPTMKITIMGHNPTHVYSEDKSVQRKYLEFTETSTEANNFSVTLLCDSMDASKDIGLLLAVNFTEKSIVRNSRIAGKWGQEEKTIPYFPFTAGDSFKMELFCEHQQIRVLIDGRQFFSFSHCVEPPQKVTALQILGDLKLTKVA